ncbi:hypothetical protein EV421DRAFT_348628 [Armillaria borealis]|uniref:Uncharacterized protein n=1 Tax=Armillaria borealis TaxID=47425 RepID=A0AA39MSQ9_9AGAR|nr:hypothetical protein EV421DRAFT_348628 [Armillaria borealis]
MYCPGYLTCPPPPAFVEAVSALLLNSVAFLKHRAKGISEMCHTLICGMRYRPEERNLIRSLVHAFVLLQTTISSCCRLDHKCNESDCPPMSTQSFDYPTQPKLSPRDPKLDKAQLTSSTDEGLRLQPIVWDNLLRKLPFFPDRDDHTQCLFHAITLSYWCIGYTPPLILTPNGLQICWIPGTDHRMVSLWTAVHTYLYMLSTNFPSPRIPGYVLYRTYWLALYPKGLWRHSFYR